jgi:hypothetical protein
VALSEGTNIGGDLPTDQHAKMVAIDLAEDMAAFDQLDPAVREAINHAPVNLAATSLLALQEALGPEVATMIAYDRIEELFPGYRPI